MQPYLKYIPLALFSLVIGGSAFGKLSMAAPLTESFAALGYATNSHVSINRALIDFVTDRVKLKHAPDVEVEILDLNNFEMPIYSIDRETEGGIPAQAQAFFDTIGAADAVLVSFAEHNGTVTAAWKNIFDWMSRIDMKVWQDKPTVILAATPGPRAGAGVLGGQEMMAPFFGMDLKGKHGVGTWGEAWDGQALTREEDIAAIDNAMSALTANTAGNLG